jgi:hypothetical protein
MKNKILSILLGALLFANSASAMQGKRSGKKLPEKAVLTIMLLCNNKDSINLSSCRKKFRETYKKLLAGKFPGVVYPVEIIIEDYVFPELKDHKDHSKKYSESELEFIRNIRQPLTIKISSIITTEGTDGYCDDGTERRRYVRANAPNLKVLADNVTKNQFLTVILSSCVISQKILKDLPKKINRLILEGCKIWHEKNPDYKLSDVKELNFILTDEEFDKQVSGYLPAFGLMIKRYLGKVDAVKFEIFNVTPHTKKIHAELDLLFSAVPSKTTNKVIFVKSGWVDNKSETETIIFAGNQLINRKIQNLKERYPQLDKWDFESSYQEDE